ncbi:MAG: TetR/AcrR family transcriptional regulator [Actinomycetota bacterium]
MAEERQLTRRGQERRERLLAYATERFAEKGYHPTSVSDIVDGVGVGKGVFYWYFESKDQLLIEILREALRDLRTTQAAAIADASDPLQRLEAGIRASIDWSVENRNIIRLVMFGWSEEQFAEVLRKGREIVIVDTARLIEQAADLGQIMSGNPTMMALAIRAVIDQLGQEYALTDGSIEPDPEMVETTVRMCLRGVRG